MKSYLVVSSAKIVPLFAKVVFACLFKKAHGKFVSM